MAAAKLRLAWSVEAETDLFEIWDYLASEASPEMADGRLREIQRGAENLLDFPRLSRERSDIRSGLRSIVSPPHVIFYQIQPDRLEIMRVLHGHRDIVRIFSNGRTD